ncbi:MAG: hypothetical protein JNK82_28060 [Myxococcaceae bacterium]|nr:hypothetical protein [Myxococcaceae bacterium]
MGGLVAVLLAAITPCEAAVGRAVVHYNDAEWDAALRELAIADRVAQTDAEHVAVWLHQGIVLANVPDAEGAKAAWRSALELQPRALLPLQVSPRVQALFDGLRPKPADAPTAVALTPKNEPAASSRVPVVPIVSLGLAVVASGVGLGLAVSASSLFSAARVAEPSARDALRAEAQTRSLAGNIAFAVAGAAAVVALITFIVLR